MTGLITICVPTYRRPALLKQTLLSCFVQDYRPLEVDIGDDSPDDSSERLVQTMTVPDGITVRYWRNTPSLGQAGNVNRLFMSARGDRLVLMHDDDLLLPGAVSALAQKWAEVPDVVAIYGMQQILHDNGDLDEVETEFKARYYRRDAAHVGEQRNLLVSALWRQFPNNGYLIETRAARRAGYRSFEEVGHACDTDFSMRLAMQSTGRCFYMIGRLTSQYRYNLDSLSRSADVTWKFYDYLRSLRELSADEAQARDQLLREIAAQATKENALGRRRRAALRILFSRFYPHGQTPLKSLYHFAITISPRAQVLRRVARFGSKVTAGAAAVFASRRGRASGALAPSAARPRAASGGALVITVVSQDVRCGHGQGRANLELVREALRCGHRVNIIASDVDAAICRDPNVTLHTIDVRGISTQLLRDAVFDLRAQRTLRRLRDSSDIVHVNGAVVASRSDVNTAHFVHGSHAKFQSGWLPLLRSPYRLYQYAYTMLNVRMERWSFRHARSVIAVSQKVACDLVELGVDPSKISVIYNGIDLAEFRPGEADRTALGLPQGVTLGLFVGDITGNRKGLDSVLRAMVTNETLHLVVLASYARSAAPALAAELGVSARVSFLGERDDVDAVMRAADMFIFPSRYEPFGMVILEAMASSLPVITSRAAGASEILEHGSGIVIDDPNDVEGLAAAIRTLVADPDLRRDMGRRARRIAERYSWEEMAKRYMTQYRTLVPADVRTVRAAEPNDRRLMASR